jgi:hypothetical protein
MPSVGFEPTIPVFEWAKTVDDLDRAATVIDHERLKLFPRPNKHLHFITITSHDKIYTREGLRDFS